MNIILKYKYFYLIVDVAKRPGNGIADLLGPVLLLCYILHHVIYLVNVALKKKRGSIVFQIQCTDAQKMWVSINSSSLHVFVDLLQGLGSEAHVL